MTPASVALIAVYLVVLLLLVKPLGTYIANVMEGWPMSLPSSPIWPLRFGARLEGLIYRVSGIDSTAQMGWKRYHFFSALRPVLARPTPCSKRRATCAPTVPISS